MKRRILFFISLFVLAQSFGQEINQLDTIGERTGVWRKFYPNDRLRYEGTFEKGKEVGIFKYYSMNASKFPMVVKTYSKSSNESKVQFFTNSGVVESEGMMLDKSRIGLWVYYHKDGKTIMIEEFYEDGNLHGPYKVYYRNRNELKSTHYKEGKLHGDFKQYSSIGVLTDDLNYVKGLLDGEATYYEPNGHIKKKGLYKQDLKVGVWEFYVNGELSESKDLSKKIEKKDN